MAPCISYCLVGAALLGSMIVTMLTSKKSKNFKDFVSLLDDNQTNIYKSITKERLNIYIQGTIIGIILAFIVKYNVNLSKNVSICVFIVIALGFNWAYYLLYPKSDYMLNHLNSQAQTQAWLKIYKEMKLRSHVGLLVGVVGYILLGMGVCN